MPILSVITVAVTLYVSCPIGWMRLNRRLKWNNGKGFHFTLLHLPLFPPLHINLPLSLRLIYTHFLRHFSPPSNFLFNSELNQSLLNTLWGRFSSFPMPSDVIVITRKGLRGGRDSSVQVAVRSANGGRVLAAIAEVVGASSDVQSGVPLVGASNVVEVQCPAKEGSAAYTVRVPALLATLEVTACGGGPQLHTTDEAVVSKLHRMLLTEFMLKDALAGHLPSSFTEQTAEATGVEKGVVPEGGKREM